MVIEAGRDSPCLAVKLCNLLSIRDEFQPLVPPGRNSGKGRPVARGPGQAGSCLGEQNDGQD
ncbi:MAG: hypothetical protein C4531_06920 [Desulfurivibrio sp.]|nr:MAG: hypothetical protein C4531_06920 [Desulfurivibrio sp.]